MLGSRPALEVSKQLTPAVWPHPSRALSSSLLRVRLLRATWSSSTTSGNTLYYSGHYSPRCWITHAFPALLCYTPENIFVWDGLQRSRCRSLPTNTPLSPGVINRNRGGLSHPSGDRDSTEWNASTIIHQQNSYVTSKTISHAQNKGTATSKSSATSKCIRFLKGFHTKMIIVTVMKRLWKQWCLQYLLSGLTVFNLHNLQCREAAGCLKMFG